MQNAYYINTTESVLVAHIGYPGVQINPAQSLEEIVLVPLESLPNSDYTHVTKMFEGMLIGGVMPFNSQLSDILEFDEAAKEYFDSIGFVLDESSDDSDEDINGDGEGGSDSEDLEDINSDAVSLLESYKAGELTAEMVLAAVEADDHDQINEVCEELDIHIGGRMAHTKGNDIIAKLGE